MKIINKEAVIDYSQCIGCRTCYSVCPAGVIEMVDKKPVIPPNSCFGCSACAESCPKYCITMRPLQEKRKVYFDPSGYDQDKIREICVNAHFYPKMEICCGGTKAEEVAAAILAGAKNPIEITRLTGIRTNCKSGCVQPIFRMLKGAGIEVGPPPGYQWYDMTETIWDFGDDIKAEYGDLYRIDGDIDFCDECNAKGLERRK